MRKNSEKRAVRLRTTALRRILPALEAIRSDLVGLVMHSGLLRLQAMLEENRVKLCGPRYEHGRERILYRAAMRPASS